MQGLGAPVPTSGVLAWVGKQRWWLFSAWALFCWQGERGTRHQVLGYPLKVVMGCRSHTLLKTESNRDCPQVHFGPLVRGQKEGGDLDFRISVNLPFLETSFSLFCYESQSEFSMAPLETQSHWLTYTPLSSHSRVSSYPYPRRSQNSFVTLSCPPPSPAIWCSSQ
jgi:hypothetical protein